MDGNSLRFASIKMNKMAYGRLVIIDYNCPQVQTHKGFNDYTRG
jgi:hypothetical protein